MASNLSSDHIAELNQQFAEELEKVYDREALDALRRRWLAKEGIVKELFKGLRSVAAE